MSHSKPRRRKGTGTLVLRGQIWHARWTDENGERSEESTGIRKGQTERIDGRILTSRELAERELMKKTEITRLNNRKYALTIIQQELEDVNQELERRRKEIEPRMTLGELADAFEKSPRRPDCTKAMLAHYRRKIADFATNVGPVEAVVDVTDAQVDAYAQELARKLSPNSYNKAINALDLCWRTIGKEAGAKGNPWERITRKRLDTKTRRPLTGEEIDKLLYTAEDVDGGLMRNLLGVGLFTGLRLGDACRIKWEDFGQDGMMHVKTSKTGALVFIPVHPVLDDFLRPTARIKMGAKGYVFPKYANEYARNRNSLARRVKRTFEKAGIATSTDKGENGRRRPACGFHSLRHTFVTKAIEVGIPTAIVQAIVGHSTMAMTEHYTHVGQAAIKEEFKKLR